jgi:hypothetical protein
MCRARFCGGQSAISQGHPGAAPTFAITIDHATSGGEALAELGTAIGTMTDRPPELTVEY